MINLDLIGGVSFKKGCYPGQEIVARTQYLGKLKRRMYRAHIATDNHVSAGDDLYGADFEDQSCGKIVNAEPSPRGGYDVLAVIQQSSVAAGKVCWKASQGMVLTIETLPYALD
jgi:folate-binding Fe-S cluster repair protein YgfZ